MWSKIYFVLRLVIIFVHNISLLRYLDTAHCITANGLNNYIYFDMVNSLGASLTYARLIIFYILYRLLSSMLSCTCNIKLCIYVRVL